MGDPEGFEEMMLDIKVAQLERFVGDLGLWHVFYRWHTAPDEEKMRLITEVAPKAIRPLVMVAWTYVSEPVEIPPCPPVGHGVRVIVSGPHQHNVHGLGAVVETEEGLKWKLFFCESPTTEHDYTVIAWKELEKL